MKFEQAYLRSPGAVIEFMIEQNLDKKDVWETRCGNFYVLHWVDNA